ncbi:MAG: SCP2 sterol-binding domain-containing protein [Oscillospiraceae bacterium]
MTYEEIVASAKQILEPKDVSDMKGHLAVQINVTGEGEGAFYVELKDGAMHVEPYEYYDRDCKLIASADTLTKLISGKLDAVFAFTTGKLKVEGSIEKALEFQKLLSATSKKSKKK